MIVDINILFLIWLCFLFLLSGALIGLYIRSDFIDRASQSKFLDAVFSRGYAEFKPCQSCLDKSKKIRQLTIKAENLENQCDIHEDYIESLEEFCANYERVFDEYVKNTESAGAIRDRIIKSQDQRLKEYKEFAERVEGFTNRVGAYEEMLRNLRSNKKSLNADSKDSKRKP